MTSNAYRKLNCSLYTKYITLQQTNLKRNPKSFWSFVNEKRKESGLPKSMYLEEETYETPTSQCEMFAKLFSSVFLEETISESHIQRALETVPPGTMNLNAPKFSTEQVRSAMSKMKLSTSAGPDGIPPIILKYCANMLCSPLTKIFNRSLSCSTFPSLWKKSAMFPTFKKGDKRNAANYRGVTSLCAGSKLFEIMISETIMRKAKSYIAFDQHGFFAGRSTSTNLTEFTSFCLKSIEEGLQVDTIYTDLKAAFDLVNHKLLLAKLRHLGVADDLVAWLGSYLINRQVSVKLGSSESAQFSNASGVPQGSNLGPLLFSVFFNDVLLMLPEKCRLGYADDVKIFLKVRTARDCKTLQAYINMFTNWCDLNRLVISTSKCAVISFSRKVTPLRWNYKVSNNDLERVSAFKDLGVLLDDKLTFREHYCFIISKANKNLGFITRISKQFKDPYCLRSLYFALVRSTLETAVVVWSPYTAYWTKRIEAIQARFIRYALRFLPWNNPIDLPDYRQRCQLLGMDTLEERRIVARAAFIKKIIDAEIDCPSLLRQININAKPRILRNIEFLHIDYQRTNYGQQEPIRAMMKIFNWFFSVYDFNISTATYKSRIRHSVLLKNYIQFCS